MRRFKSIGFRLTASFTVMFAILIAFGVTSLAQLQKFNQESAAIRERWLRSTRYLGDLNNYTSDFRALEATLLLAPRQESLTDARTLDQAIAQAQAGYEGVAHDPSEVSLYQQFHQLWNDYRNEAAKVFEAALSQKSPEALTMYLASSRDKFSAASNLLDQLTALNNRRAEQASEKTATTIALAWSYSEAGMIFAVLIALGTIAYAVRTVVLPLKKLAQCIRSLAEGETEVEIPGVSQQDELGDLGRAVTIFRSNAIDLRVSHRGLASQASMLEEKLAHERRLNEQQRNFIAMASHEFRTPLMIIDGHAQRLLNSQYPAAFDKIGERAGRIRTAVKRMNAIIDNILRSSKFFDEKPSLYLHKSEFDIRALLHEVCKMHREISARAVIIEELGAQPVIVWGDRDLLYQAFNNLVANSVKYSSAGGEINVSTKLSEERIKVLVKDEGIGIPKSDLPHLFERHYRGGNVAGIVGTGIGLFLVKIVIDLHEGAVAVTSEQNVGSTFEISLPRHFARDAQPKADSPTEKLTHAVPLRESVSPRRRNS
jgi:two-component system, OmpR family, sensor kinase